MVCFLHRFQHLHPYPALLLTSLLFLQVHRAVMTIEGVRRVVAVKVRHPGVADIIRRDFQV